MTRPQSGQLVRSPFAEEQHRNFMKRLALTPCRYYFAIGALIALFLIQRPLANPQWSAGTALQAGVADLLILLLLAAAHWVVERLWSEGAGAVRASRAVHFALATAIITVVVFSQILFVKTGELLDFAIIEFGLRNAAALKGVASGEMDWETAQPLLFALGFVALAGINLPRPAVRRLVRLTLAMPILLLPACELAERMNGREAAASPVEAGKGLYRGVYANWKQQELAWNASARQGWTMGILSGMSFGTAFGRLEFDTYSRKAGVERIYAAPSVHVEARQTRPNVLVVVLESIRHDVIGAYRRAGSASSSVTPFIDEFARGSRVVERAYTTIPHTSKALVGLYCGTFPRFDPEITEGTAGGLSIPCLPTLLARAGYRSAHFQTASATFESRGQLLRNMGFDDFTTQESFAGENWPTLGYLGIDDRALIRPAAQWMVRQHRAGTPFFASVLTLATHHPYVSPGNPTPPETPAEAYASYLEGLRYTDRVIADLFAELDKNGVLDNTLVIITGDHGEGFAEHGQIAHNGTAYEEGMRVPLIIRSPVAPASTEPIRGLRQHIDVMPTVLEAAGLTTAGRLPGRSLLTDANGHASLITSCFYKDYCLTHLDDAGRKLIYLYSRRALEHYDLNADPHERANLFVPDAPQEAAAEEQLLSAVRLRNSYASVWE
ncbi:MAG: sulfatase [Thauera sp.]|nr:sulfatase [Thauera sp.]